MSVWDCEFRTLILVGRIEGEADLLDILATVKRNGHPQFSYEWEYGEKTLVVGTDGGTDALELYKLCVDTFREERVVPSI